MNRRIRAKFNRAVDSTWFLWRDNRSEMEINRKSRIDWRSLLTWMRLDKKGWYSK